MTATVKLLGVEHPLELPASFAVREDLCTTWNRAGGSIPLSRRAFGAALGFCVPAIAKAAGADYAACDYDPLRFGQAVYDHLRASGASNDAIFEAARACFRATAAVLFPREPEVKERLGESEGTGAPSTV